MSQNILYLCGQCQSTCTHIYVKCILWYYIYLAYKKCIYGYTYHVINLLNVCDSALANYFNYAKGVAHGGLLKHISP